MQGWFMFTPILILKNTDTSISDFISVFVKNIIIMKLFGYIASSKEDLNMHKRIHGLIFIL